VAVRLTVDTFSALNDLQRLVLNFNLRKLLPNLQQEILIDLDANHLERTKKTNLGLRLCPTSVDPGWTKNYELPILAELHA
jgi:hypothetical protein